MTDRRVTGSDEGYENQPVAFNEAGEFNPFGEPGLEEPVLQMPTTRFLQ
jgi:hypothetical protein